MDPQERSAQHALHRRPRTRLPGPPTNRAATTCPARTPWRVTKRPLVRMPDPPTHRTATTRPMRTACCVMKRPLDRRTPRWLTAVMSETAITGIHHVTLSVSDLDRTVEWYVGCWASRSSGGSPTNGLDKAMVRRDGVLVTFVCHGDLAVPGPLNERQAGLDHLSFAVADRAALDAWVARRDGDDVEHSDIVPGATGDLVPFRDPDNIALEFYTRPA